MGLIPVILPPKGYRGGKAVRPTTDTGWATYAGGSRLFLPAGTNLFPNPSFEIDSNSDGRADGFLGPNVAGLHDTLVESLVAGRLGGYAQRIAYTGVAADVGTYVSANVFEAGSAGQTYTISAYLKGVCAGGYAYFSVSSFDSSWNYLGAQNSALFDPTSSWVRQALTYTLAANAQFNYFALQVDGIDEGDVVELDMDDLLFEASTALRPYFDGFTPSCSWSGTAHASASTRDVSSLILPYATGPSGTIAYRRSLLSGGVSNQGAVMAIDANGSECVHGGTNSYGEEWFARSGSANTIAADTTTETPGTVRTVVDRWDTTSTDLNLDGTDAAQEVSSVTVPAGVAVRNNQPMDGGYLGPVIVSNERKSDAWVDAIQANLGAAFSDLNRLYREFMSKGDLLIPLRSNGIGWVKR